MRLARQVCRREVSLVARRTLLPLSQDLDRPLLNAVLTPLPSTIRQVPDNQEVYIDKDGFTSIIFDITQRVDAPGSGLERDGRALTVHLEDLVGDDADSVKVWNTTETEFSHLPCVPPSRCPCPPTPSQ